MKIHLKTLSAKWHPFCLGLNVLTLSGFVQSSICVDCDKLGLNKMNCRDFAKYILMAFLKKMKQDICVGEIL